jgi:hypothetical protein
VTQHYTFGTFLSLTRGEVDAEAERQKRSPTGHVWVGLFHLMARHGSGRVREVGTSAANSWAIYLQAIDR